MIIVRRFLVQQSLRAMTGQVQGDTVGALSWAVYFSNLLDLIPGAHDDADDHLSILHFRERRCSLARDVDQVGLLSG